MLDRGLLSANPPPKMPVAWGRRCAAPEEKAMIQISIPMQYGGPDVVTVLLLACLYAACLRLAWRVLVRRGGRR